MEIRRILRVLEFGGMEFEVWGFGDWGCEFEVWRGRV